MEKKLFNEASAERCERVEEQDEVTEEQFDAYVEVQMSGVTNMWAVNTVCELSGLEKETVRAIMKNYGALKEKYKGAE